MAWELPLGSVGNLLTTADLSGNQHYCVKVSTTNNKVALCDTAGEYVFGVLQNKPASGEVADVMVLGVTKVVANETLAAGDSWGTASNGKAQKIEASATGADIRSYACGKVIEGAASGELATVSIGFPAGQVSA